MRYYPVFLDLTDKPCVVIGGGQVALRKVEGLLEAGAQVAVISPQLSDGLAALRDQGRISHIERPYRPGDLASCSLAIVATDDRSVNAAAAREARERGVWINAVDDPAHCDFVAPAVIQRGDLLIAISTSGGSPALARKVREELEQSLSEDYVPLLDLASEVRRELKGRDISVEPQVWNSALGDAEMRRILREGEREEAKERLLRLLLGPATTKRK